MIRTLTVRTIRTINYFCPQLRTLTAQSCKEAADGDVWVPTIGLEVHAQLLTNSKLFSAAPIDYALPPNAGVFGLDAGWPGTLPVLNRRCVQLALMVARALECRIPESCSFDRKHYFYGDLPLGFQITQQRAPIATNGCLRFVHGDCDRVAHIERIQLEQDAGKSLHSDQLTLIDLNRAGAPLIELVFEPELRSGHEASALVAELTHLLTRLGACSGRLEQGALRVDANVSVSKTREELGVRTEVKNLNSLKAVRSAVDYEIQRQTKLLTKGQTIVRETRSWQDDQTVAARQKETTADYRFFRDPNLGRLDLSSIEEMVLPRLPHEERDELRREFRSFGPQQLLWIVRNNFKELFQKVLRKVDGNEKGEQLLFRLLAEEEAPYKSSDLLATCIRAHLDRKISLDNVLGALEMNSEESLDILIDRHGWKRIVDAEVIRATVEEAVKTAPSLSKQYSRKHSNFALKKLLSVIRMLSGGRIERDDAHKELDRILRHGKQ